MGLYMFYLHSKKNLVDRKNIHGGVNTYDPPPSPFQGGGLQFKNLNIEGRFCIKIIFKIVLRDKTYINNQFVFD
jgi:hypothetical protein